MTLVQTQHDSAYCLADRSVTEHAHCFPSVPT